MVVFLWSYKGNCDFTQLYVYPSSIFIVAICTQNYNFFKHEKVKTCIHIRYGKKKKIKKKFPPSLMEFFLGHPFHRKQLFFSMASALTSEVFMNILMFVENGAS